jgi:hypothetical protein
VKTLALACALLIVSPPASAQSVSDVLDFLVTNNSIETGSVERDRAAAEAASAAISRALLANLATLPVTSSSGAFSYRLNPLLGTVERSTQTFGPAFVERALTDGRFSAAAGFSFQHITFDRLDGRNLRDGSIITTANQFADESDPFDVDRMKLAIDADVATAYASMGLTDWLDVAIALPMVSMRLDGERINTYRGRTFTQASASARTFGLADTMVRSKLRFFEQDGRSLAALVDVRLPTGSRDNLLGAGSRSMKFEGIGSIERGRLSSHANLGFSTGGLASEISYGAAVAAAPLSRITLTAELVGRLIDSPGHLVMTSASHPTLSDVNTLRLTPDDSRLHVVTFAPGFKWNIVDTWVIVGNVGWTLTRGGLTASATPFIGLDYALGQIF